MTRKANEHTHLLILVASLVVAIALACGGSARRVGAERPGEGQAASGGGAEGGGEAAEQGDEGGEGGAGHDGEEVAHSEETQVQVPPVDAVVTFVLQNSHDQDLAFNMDLGWQPNLFAYTGKPPKAVSILMFPKFCTESCEAAAAVRCPSCPQPETAKDILAAQKMQKVAPGGKLEVPWDGQIFVYSKTQDGKKQACECHRKEAAPPGTYTVKACGLRLTTTAEERSRLQCAEGKMKLPPDDGLRVELDFGAPAAVGKNKKKK